jgi:demethoxyubiquinone hydroxylase (CLK1/Coq7/Cat5 family)
MIAYWFEVTRIRENSNGARLFQYFSGVFLSWLTDTGICVRVESVISRCNCNQKFRAHYAKQLCNLQDDGFRARQILQEPSVSNVRHKNI